MTGILGYFILSFVSLFVIIDPIGAIPSFLVMTDKNNLSDRIRTAMTAAITTFIILISFLACGVRVLNIFSITLPAFQIAGGIILMIIALDMLQARRTGLKETSAENEEGASKSDIGVTPLALPMLAGPGAITTIILLGQKAATWVHKLALAADVFLVCLLIFIILNYAAKHSKNINVIGMRIMARIMGLLLSAISVQFILDGIREAIRIW